MVIRCTIHKIGLGNPTPTTTNYAKESTSLVPETESKTEIKGRLKDFDLLLGPNTVKPPTQVHKSNFRQQRQRQKRNPNRNRNRRIDTKEIKNSNKFLTLPSICMYLYLCFYLSISRPRNDFHRGLTL